MVQKESKNNSTKLKRPMFKMKREKKSETKANAEVETKQNV